MLSSSMPLTFRHDDDMGGWMDCEPTVFPFRTTTFLAFASRHPPLVRCRCEHCRPNTTKPSHTTRTKYHYYYINKQLATWERKTEQEVVRFCFVSCYVTSDKSWWICCDMKRQIHDRSNTNQHRYVLHVGGAREIFHSERSCNDDMGLVFCFL